MLYFTQHTTPAFEGHKELVAWLLKDGKQCVRVFVFVMVYTCERVSECETVRVCVCVCVFVVVYMFERAC
jgi:hypothetical protein